jgi:hypothetical protein
MKKPVSYDTGFFHGATEGMQSRRGERPRLRTTGSRGRERPSAAREGRGAA